MLNAILLLYKGREGLNCMKFIGLKNFGATCYLNSLLQQMYMIPTFKEDLFNIDKRIEEKNNLLKGIKNAKEEIFDKKKKDYEKIYDEKKEFNKKINKFNNDLKNNHEKINQNDNNLETKEEEKKKLNFPMKILFKIQISTKIIIII